MTEPKTTDVARVIQMIPIPPGAVWPKPMPPPHDVVQAFAQAAEIRGVRISDVGPIRFVGYLTPPPEFDTPEWAGYVAATYEAEYTL